MNGGHPHSESKLVEDEELDYIRQKLQVLKKVIVAIEEEFKQKGQVDMVGYINYYRERGVFFDPIRYATEKKMLIYQKALEVVNALYKAFPYIPYEEIIHNIEFPPLNIIGSTGTQWDRYAKVWFLSTEDPIFKLTPIFSLIRLCESLNSLQVIHELEKPLFITLAYIFKHSNNQFSKTDYQKLKTVIIDKAINLALKSGWIVRIGQETYQIITRPDFVIKCPNCDSSISAYEEHCPKCGLYLLNIILKDVKKMEDFIPQKLFEMSLENKKLFAYFYLSVSDEEIEVEEGVDYFSVRASYFLGKVFDKLLKLGLVSKMLDHEKYAEYYTKELGYLLLYNTYEGYYKVEGESIREIKEKLNKILNILREEVVSEAKKKLYRRRKMDYALIKELLRICENSFLPKLDEHPILSVEKEEAVEVEEIRKDIDKKIAKIKEFLKNLE